MNDENTLNPNPVPAVVYDKNNLFPSTLKRRVLLNKEGTDKETLHLEMCLAGSGLEYCPGDSLAIVPTNSAEVVERTIEAGGFDPGEKVEIKSGATKPLGEAFTSALAITGLTKIILKKYNDFAQSEKIETLLDSENRATLEDYLWGREVVD